MNARLLLLVLLAVSLPALASTQVYSWTDGNGVKHFSDSPPPASVNAQKIKVRGSVTSEATGSAEPAPGSEAPKPNGPAPAAVQPIARSLADSAENRDKQCQTAKKNLDILQGSYPVSAPAAADGTARVMDDAARKQASDRAAEQVKFYCR